MERVHHFARFPQTSVSLSQLVRFGAKPSQATLLQATRFLAEELPIRYAHRVAELEQLPPVLAQCPSVDKVRGWYLQSFKELTDFPKLSVPDALRKAKANVSRFPAAQPNRKAANYERRSGWLTSGGGNVPLMLRKYYVDTEDVPLPDSIREYNAAFIKLIESIKRRHDPVATTLAQGINEYKTQIGSGIIDMQLQSFLDRFFMSRIGIRVLIGQHIALDRTPVRPGYVGIINTNTSVAQVAKQAIDDASYICEEYYGLYKAPAVELSCPKDLTFTYIPSHLHHMIFELLKNSLRATVEYYGDDVGSYPPIKLSVSADNDEIVVKISDEGGGIAKSAQALVWTYMYTTAIAPQLAQDYDASDFRAPLAGFGYGLPMSRLYSRYFGGDLTLRSHEGHGTEAFIHLPRHSDHEEPLP
ncbi:pyruvate dehydrogenase kinase [Ramicandelaber brevisporus]|nr:pyruvate dehydrogenase kinase [Ramicandelaber brevisporus]